MIINNPKSCLLRSCKPSSETRAHGGLWPLSPESWPQETSPASLGATPWQGNSPAHQHQEKPLHHPGGSKDSHKADSPVGLGREPPPNPLSTPGDGVQCRRDVETLPSPWQEKAPLTPATTPLRSSRLGKQRGRQRKLGWPKKGRRSHVGHLGTGTWCGCVCPEPPTPDRVTHFCSYSNNK